MKIRDYSFLFILILISISCAEKIQFVEKVQIKNTTKVEKTNKIEEPIVPKIEHKSILLGIDVLERNNFEILKNKRVGLITNQTGVNRHLESTIDILNEAQNVNLVSLFGPEHGVRGDIEGGKYVEFYNDPKTNLPVYSLYGKTRKPNKEMLENLDVLIYDIQDIGVRSYTFISTMGLAIEAASENNLEFVVLDRPNPLGGEKVEGNIVEKEFTSFISQFPIPYVYGLTCGELANFLLREKMVKTTSEFKLNVLPMENWKRSMTWENTKLEWIPTSPHIPHSNSPNFYPMTGILGELRSAISIGVGYTLPFQIVAAEWINGIELADYLNNNNIHGLYFRPITYKPYYAFGKGKTLHGVQIHITNFREVNLTNTQFHIMIALQNLYPQKELFKMAHKNEISMFNKGIGTDKLQKLIKSKSSLNSLLNYLNKNIESFKNISKKYYLYK